MKINLVIGSKYLPPAHEVRRKVIFSVCLSVHTLVHTHLRATILPLVPCTFQGVAPPSPSHNTSIDPMSFSGGYPSPRQEGTPWLGQDGVLPARSGWVTPLARTGWGTPTARTGWGTPWLGSGTSHPGYSLIFSAIKNTLISLLWIWPNIVKSPELVKSFPVRSSFHWTKSKP